MSGARSSPAWATRAPRPRGNRTPRSTPISPGRASRGLGARVELRGLGQLPSVIVTTDGRRPDPSPAPRYRELPRQQGRRGEVALRAALRRVPGPRQGDREPGREAAAPGATNVARRIDYACAKDWILDPKKLDPMT